jgi:phage baseplate assembly protein W
MAVYTDFFNNFTVHPDTHDLAMKTDSRAIQQSLRNLVLTNTRERPYQPRIGGNIRQLLFAPVSPQIADAIKKQLQELIQNCEKRVIVKEVKADVNLSQRSYDLWISYYELNKPNPTSLYINLTRIR